MVSPFQMTISDDGLYKYKKQYSLPIFIIIKELAYNRRQ